MAFGRGFLAGIWYFLSSAGAVKAGALGRETFMGEPIALGRTRSGEAFALADVCPHRAAPLSAGRMTLEADGRESLECPYHGWRFAPDGRCLAIPSLAPGQSLEIGRFAARRRILAESEGMLFLWAPGREGETPYRPPPTFPAAIGAPRLVESLEFAAHIDHAVVGLMDPAHGPFVHRQWWWRSRRSAHEKAKAFAPTPEGFAMLRHAPSRNSRAYALLGGRPTTEITFRLPALRWEHVVVGRRRVLALTALTPVSDCRTKVTQMVWSDHPVFAVAAPLIALATRRFLRQDGEMVNLQNLAENPDPSLLWIDDADRQAKWYQALKSEWTAARAQGRPFVNPVRPATLRWVS